ncbi:hypothetical protein N7463_010751 [Penicillium fimorum]|uniref:Uncharacterized protein n=1 Tax=Penicillium fimorum TaxID=1882269 RepID=A0A9X0C229_9EURO|nr:hypothetical protein N7463_010751 [Penicillium fimorum]
MAKQTPYYFYAPTWDIPPPPTGPIQLGNVLTSLRTPDQPIYTATLPNSDSDVFSSEKKNVTFSRERHRGGNFSILTRFMAAVLGVGVDVGVEVDRSENEVLTFDTITTTQFIPSTVYIQEKCIDTSAAVRRWLERSRYRKPLYVITGIKVVMGAKMGKSETVSKTSGNLGISVDGTVCSGGVVPIGGGPGIEGTRSRKMGLEWEDGGDFVLAFRVKRFKVGRKNLDVTREDDYRKGAMLGVGAEEKNASVSVVEDDEVGIEDLEWEGVEVTEGDDVLVVGMPRARVQE